MYAIIQKAQTFRFPEVTADIGQLVDRRNIVDTDCAAVHQLSYVKYTLSNVFGSRVERLVAHDVVSSCVAKTSVEHLRTGSLYATPLSYR